MTTNSTTPAQAPGWTRWLRWAPPAVLSVAALVLAALWSQLPEVWPVHWDGRGNVNGWAHRDLPGVFGPLGFGLIVWLVLEGVAASAALFTRPQAGMEPVQAATRGLLRAVATAQALLFGTLAVALPLSAGRIPGPALIVGPIAVVVLALWGIGRTFSRALHQVRATLGEQALEGYHALYYSNAKDPRLWVPKLAGMGWTVNFAHRWGWPVMLALIGFAVGFPLGLAALSEALAGR